MTDIIDPNKTIKTVEKSQEWVDLLTKKYNLHTIFRDVDSDVIDIIMQKCGGVSIYCLHFFFHLLTNGYIEIDRHGVVVETKNLI